MKQIIILLFLIGSFQSISQSLDTTFFHNFHLTRKTLLLNMERNYVNLHGMPYSVKRRRSVHNV